MHFIRLDIKVQEQFEKWSWVSFLNIRGRHYQGSRYLLLQSLSLSPPLAFLFVLSNWRPLGVLWNTEMDHGIAQPETLHGLPMAFGIEFKLLNSVLPWLQTDSPALCLGTNCDWIGDTSLLPVLPHTASLLSWGLYTEDSGQVGFSLVLTLIVPVSGLTLVWMITQSEIDFFRAEVMLGLGGAH